MARSSIMLSQAGLAARWHKDVRTIRRWTEKGLLPTFTDPDSERVMYPLASIEAWEASHMAPGKASA